MSRRSSATRSAVLVDNEPGMLARVVGLFSGRGYNIESLTVAEVDPAEQLSRITIVTSGTPMMIEQIKAQLDRLVPVHKVRDLTDEGPHRRARAGAGQGAGTGEKRVEALRIADIFRARVVDATIESFVFEMTGATEKLDAFIDLMRPLGLVEVARTGVVAIARGPGADLTLSDPTATPLFAERKLRDARLLRSRCRCEPDQGQEGRHRRLWQPGPCPCPQPADSGVKDVAVALRPGSATRQEGRGAPASR